MLRHKRGRIEWLEFEIFQEFSEIQHAIFLRHGEDFDFSVGHVGGGSESDHEKSRFNRNRIIEILGCSSLEAGFQVHGDILKEAPLENKKEACDALFTHENEMGLMIKHADCQAAIFYDPVQKVIANAHAGWKGNVKNIYKRLIEELGSRYGSKPENLIVGMAPSLGPCCSEFIHYKTELPEHFWTYQVKELHFNLWEIARMQLLEAGVLPEHLQIAGICTKCNAADFFSYRREKAGCGNHATVIFKKNFF